MLISSLVASIVGLCQTLQPVTRVPLAFHLLTEKEVQQAPHMMYGILDHASKGVRFEGSDQPANLEWTLITIAGRQVDVAASIGSDKTRFESVWVDINGNGVFEATEKAAYAGKDAQGKCSLYQFGKPPHGKFGRLYFRMECPSPQVIRFRTIACLEGEIVYRGALKKLRIFDQDFDGSFGSWIADSHDQISIGEGADSVSWNFGYIFKDAVFGFAAAKVVGGKTAEICQIASPTGRLLAKNAKPNPAILTGDQGCLNVDLHNGDGQIPIGEWTVQRGTLRGWKSGDSEQFISFTNVRAPKIKVAFGPDTALPDFGSGVHAILAETKDPNKVAFRASVEDALGYRYQPLGYGTPEGFTPYPLPSITLYGPHGNPIANIQTVFGDNEQVLATWLVPDGAERGEYRAEIVWQTGAFGLLKAEVKFTL